MTPLSCHSSNLSLIALETMQLLVQICTVKSFLVLRQRPTHILVKHLLKEATIIICLFGKSPLLNICTFRLKSHFHVTYLEK